MKIYIRYTHTKPVSNTFQARTVAELSAQSSAEDSLCEQIISNTLQEVYFHDILDITF